MLQHYYEKEYQYPEMLDKPCKMAVFSASPTTRPKEAITSGLKIPQSGFRKPEQHWIWYDFKTSQPRCELTPPTADRYVPDAFSKHVASSQVSFTSKYQGAGITLTSPSLSGRAQDDQGFASGDGISDEFKLWLSRHPGLSIDEALHR